MPVSESLDYVVIKSDAAKATGGTFIHRLTMLAPPSLTAPSTSIRWLLVVAAFAGGFAFWASLGPYGDFASVCVFAGTFLVLIGLGQQITDLFRLEHPELEDSDSLHRGWRAAILGRILLAAMLILFCAVRSVWYWVEPTVLSITGNEPWVGWWDNPGQQVCDAALYTLLLIGVAPEQNKQAKRFSLTGTLSAITAIVAVPAVLILVNQQAIFTALVSFRSRGVDAASSVALADIARYPENYAIEIKQLLQLAALGLFVCCLDPRQLSSLLPRLASPRSTVATCVVSSTLVTVLCIVSVRWFQDIEPDLFRGVLESLMRTSWAIYVVATIPVIAIAIVLALRPSRHATEVVLWGKGVHYVNEGYLVALLLALPLFFSMKFVVFSGLDIVYHGLTTGTYWSPDFHLALPEWTDNVFAWLYDEVLHHPLLLGMLWALILRLMAIGTAPSAKELYGKSKANVVSTFVLSLVRLTGIAIFSLLAAHCAVVTFTSL